MDSKFGDLPGLVLRILTTLVSGPPGVPAGAAKGQITDAMPNNADEETRTLTAQ